MNWKLLFRLSLIGFAMSLATISVIPMKIEPILWLVIFIICSWLIAKEADRFYFWHGFVLSLINCIYITGAHIIFYSTYIANHAEMAKMNNNMPLSNHPRLMMLIMGPLFGIVFGLMQGLFSFIASKLVKKQVAS
jgi:hypothetical protein